MFTLLCFRGTDFALIQVSQSIRDTGVEAVCDIGDRLLHGYLLGEMKVIVVVKLRCGYTFATSVRTVNKLRLALRSGC